MMQKARKNRNISIWKWDIIMNRKHSLIMRILKTTAQRVDSLSWDSKPSCMPAQEVGFMRMVFPVIFIVKSAHQNRLWTLQYYPTKVQRTTTDIIILWALLFKKSSFFTDFRACRVTSIQNEGPRTTVCG